MKLVIVCPRFPPDAGGVADYAYRLARELAREGHETSVVTWSKEPDSPQGVRTRVVGSLREAASAIRELSPEATVVQYTPYMYARRGIAPRLPAWIRSLRTATGRPVAVMAHELHYPVRAGIDGLAIGLPQFLQFQAIALLADHVFFSYERAWKDCSSRYPWRKDRYSWLPVSSNVDVADPGSKPDPAEGLGIGREAKILLQFGGAHPTRLAGHALASLRAAQNRFGEQGARLVLVGISETELESVPAGVHALGFRDESETSAWIRRSDVVIAPLMDGISTRRSSVMSVLAHGKPVVSQRSYSSDPSVPWESFMKIADGPSEESFARAVVEVLSDPGGSRELGQAARQAYLERFDWPLLCRELLKQIQKHSRPG